MAQCPSCGRDLQVTQDDGVSCPECDSLAKQAPARHTPSLAEYLLRFPATTVLLALNILVFAAMVLFGHVSPKYPTTDQLIRWGADSGEKVILHNQWWRIITAAFIHIGAIHLVMNMWALWVLGTLAEAVLGTYLYLGIYFVSAIAGSLASLYWHPAAVGAGASGAIIGILGAVVSVLKFARLPLPKEVLRSTLRSLIQGAALTLAIGIWGPIDNAAHVGGLACGLFIGLLLAWTRRAGPILQRPLRQICLIVPFALMVPLAFAVQKQGEPRVHYVLAWEYFGAQHYDQAEKEARLALRRLPNRADVLEILSKALFLENKDAEADKYLQQLIAVDPHNQFAVNTLALIDLRDGNAIVARDLLAKELSLQPRNADGQVYLGRALQELNQDSEAIAHYRLALQIDPNLFDAQLGLASIYEKSHKLPDALLLYQKAAQTHPDSLEALRGLARAYLAAGLTQQANQTIAQIRNREQVTRGQGTGKNEVSSK